MLPYPWRETRRLTAMLPTSCSDAARFVVPADDVSAHGCAGVNMPEVGSSDALSAC